MPPTKFDPALLEQIATELHKSLVETKAAVDRTPELNLHADLEELESIACGMRASGAVLIESGSRLQGAAGQLDALVSILRSWGKLP